MCLEPQLWLPLPMKCDKSNLLRRYASSTIYTLFWINFILMLPYTPVSSLYCLRRNSASVSICIVQPCFQNVCHICCLGYKSQVPVWNVLLRWVQCKLLANPIGFISLPDSKFHFSARRGLVEGHLPRQLGTISQELRWDSRQGHIHSKKGAAIHTRACSGRHKMWALIVKELFDY